MSTAKHIATLSTLTGIAAAVLSATPAAAQPACAQRDEITTALQQSHSEVPVARGLASDGVMIEVLAAESGSFTVLLTRADGISCLITAGEYWETFKPRDGSLTGMMM